MRQAPATDYVNFFSKFEVIRVFGYVVYALLYVFALYAFFMRVFVHFQMSLKDIYNVFVKFRNLQVFRKLTQIFFCLLAFMDYFSFVCWLCFFDLIQSPFAKKRIGMKFRKHRMIFS